MKMIIKRLPIKSAVICYIFYLIWSSVRVLINAVSEFANIAFVLLGILAPQDYF